MERTNQRKKELVHGVRFLDSGGRTGAARRRVNAFWEARCAHLQRAIGIVVLPTEVYDLLDSEWALRCGLPRTQKDASLGMALNLIADTMIVPTESLRQWHWQATLEHELLHIQHPSWGEATVERKALRRVEELDLGFH